MAESDRESRSILRLNSGVNFRLFMACLLGPKTTLADCPNLPDHFSSRAAARSKEIQSNDL